MPFTITPDTHYTINKVSGCGGSLSGSTYTTGAVTADCTVTASFYPEPVNFTDGQAASVVIGQADFTSKSFNRGGQLLRIPLAFPAMVSSSRAISCS